MGTHRARRRVAVAARRGHAASRRTASMEVWRVPMSRSTRKKRHATRRPVRSTVFSQTGALRPMALRSMAQAVMAGTHARTRAVTMALRRPHARATGKWSSSETPRVCRVPRWHQRLPTPRRTWWSRRTATRTTTAPLTASRAAGVLGVIAPSRAASVAPHGSPRRTRTAAARLARAPGSVRRSMVVSTAPPMVCPCLMTCLVTLLSAPGTAKSAATRPRARALMVGTRGARAQSRAGTPLAQTWRAQGPGLATSLAHRRTTTSSARLKQMLSRATITSARSPVCWEIGVHGKPVHCTPAALWAVCAASAQSPHSLSTVLMRAA